MLQVVVEVAGSVAEVLMYFYPLSFDYYVLLQTYIRYNNSRDHIYKGIDPLYGGMGEGHGQRV